MISLLKMCFWGVFGLKSDVSCRRKHVAVYKNRCLFRCFLPFEKLLCCGFGDFVDKMVVIIGALLSFVK